jgi:16S rRNA (uracil1498-N3)-methyltransferase
VLAIGPEGGIEADELASLAAAGFRPVRLGPTVLRFETAAVAAVAVARTALGASPSNPKS